MVIRRGEVWWADLNELEGSGPGYRRPVVVIQANSFNASGIATVIGVAITSNLRLARAPGNLELSARGATRLPKASAIVASQIVTLDKSALIARAGKLTAKQIELLNDGLRLVLAV
jgi:mRNA interferase MazF